MPNLKSIGFMLVVALGLSACANNSDVKPIEPGERPALDTDEAGLWMQVERAEEKLRTSGKVVIDPDLNTYVSGIVCKLEPQYCQDIRVYVVNAAGFNASMAPNGAMHVWTGLLLRVENEAQLANVLAHELAHYRLRHSVQRWRDLRAKTDGLVFFQLATAMVGAAPIGALAGLATVDSVLGFSRDQEREADKVGFDSMTAAGYDPREAPRIWEYLVEEKAASNGPKRSFFNATHPLSEERKKTLAASVEKLGELSNELELGQDRYQEETERFRLEWLRQELKVADFGRSLVLIDRLLERHPSSGDLLFAKGEVLRRRNTDGDLDAALLAYLEAQQTKSYPPDLHRSVALVKWTQGNRSEAADAFEQYLLMSPDADDRLIIRDYISQLR